MKFEATIRGAERRDRSFMEPILILSLDDGSEIRVPNTATLRRAYYVGRPVVVTLETNGKS